MTITKHTSTHNTSKYANRPVEWIVLHYTAGTTSKPGSAINTAEYFKTADRQASADFCVDDSAVVQYNGDIKNRYCWAVGGGKYSERYNSLSAKYYGVCKNSNSVSIEMCSNKVNKSHLGGEDTDWYLTDATVANSVWLTRYLMEQFNIDADHVIMHNMCTGKCCPNPWSLNEACLKNWYAFKARLSDEPEVNDEITQEEFNLMFANAIQELSKQEPSTWSADARAWAESNNIINGDDSGGRMYKKFSTREELVRILYNLNCCGQLGSKIKSALNGKNDCTPSTWSEQDRKWAEDSGIVLGDGSGNKGYCSYLTKEQMVALLHRAMKSLS